MGFLVLYRDPTFDLREASGLVVELLSLRGLQPYGRIIVPVVGKPQSYERVPAHGVGGIPVQWEKPNFCLGSRASNLVGETESVLLKRSQPDRGDTASVLRESPNWMVETKFCSRGTLNLVRDI